ncbi:hypothetical protein JXB41_07950 [Candidatus Woesearchaeota archaeon]|nr:hypothetical protein [Candidatus Woesearchaeota archaeon]
MPTKSVDTPLSEITLRRYEKPYGLSKRELARKLCLSLGLLQPGDSRDIIVDILYVLLEAKKNNKKLSSEEIRDEVIEFRNAEKLDLNGTAASNIRRQLKRLRNLIIVEKIKNDYRITEFINLAETFESKIERFLIPSIIERIKEYINEIDNAFSNQEQEN